MKRFFRNSAVVLSAVSMAIAPIQAQAQTQDREVELVSNGGMSTYRLPDDVTQVELTQQIRCGCRFGRSWGYA